MNSTLVRLIGLLAVFFLGFLLVKSIIGVLIIGVVAYTAYRVYNKGVANTIAEVIAKLKGK